MRNKLLLATSILFTHVAVAADQPIVGNPDAGKQKITVCATCHGVDGNSTIPMNPNLAGQHADYLIHAMTEYQQGATGPRNNAIMAGMVAGLSAQDIADIAVYYSSQTETVGEADPTLVKQGEALYRGGDSERGIPACIACHGPAGAGNAPANFPKVADQHPEYVIAALKEYQSGARSNVMMSDIAKRMSDDEMKAVASYIYGLYPTGMKLPEPTPVAATNTQAATGTNATPATTTNAAETAPADTTTKPADTTAPATNATTATPAAIAPPGSASSTGTQK